MVKFQTNIIYYIAKCEILNVDYNINGTVRGRVEDKCNNNLNFQNKHVGNLY